MAQKKKKKPAPSKKASVPKKGSASSHERRRFVRRPLLDSFSLFVVVPKKGGYRLRVHDVSDGGLGFDIDTEGEVPEFPIAPGQKFAVRLYLNQSLYLPLQVAIVRLVDDSSGLRKVGVEIADRGTAGYRAFKSFLGMLDALHDGGRLDAESL